MPFKSKAQQRFMFAAESPGFRGEADIPKGTARRWAHETPNIKKLPEKKKEKNAMDAKTARALGHLRALDEAFGKEAALGETALRALLRYGAPGAAGYYLAGPGYRTEGLVGGLAAGHLAGPGLARMAMGKMNPEVAAAIASKAKGAPGNWREAAQMVRAGTLPGAKDIGALQKQLRMGEKWLGPIGLGAAGGYGAGRMLGLQNPYGLQPVFPGYGRENPYGMRPE